MFTKLGGLRLSIQLAFLALSPQDTTFLKISFVDLLFHEVNVIKYPLLALLTRVIQSHQVVDVRLIPISAPCEFETFKVGFHIGTLERNGTVAHLKQFEELRAVMAYDFLFI